MTLKLICITYWYLKSKEGYVLGCNLGLPVGAKERIYVR